jgi:hypothetical protein
MKSIRLEATKYIWTGYAVVMSLMFGSTFFNNVELGAGHVVLGVVVSIATFLCTGSVWNWGSVKLESEFVEAEESSSEKQKRQNARGIDRLLDQLSDDELLDLREDLRQRRYSSDGELLYRETKR